MTNLRKSYIYMGVLIVAWLIGFIFMIPLLIVIPSILLIISAIGGAILSR